MNEELHDRLQKRFVGRPRNAALEHRPRPTAPPASITFSELTDEVKARQEAERIKHKLPF